MSTRDLGQGPVVPWDATDLLPGLTRLTASSRAASTRAAEDAVLLADLAARVPRAPGDERGGTAWTSFLREVAVARRCSDRAAAADVAQAVQLVRMPVTLGLLRSGDLPVPQMRALVEETWTAGASTLARIDAEVGSRATRLSPSRVRDAARKVLLREEAEAVAVRAAKAAADRQVRRRPLADDQAEIVLVGPAVPVAQAYDALDAEARALRAAGDGRTLDALRFDLALHRLSGASLVAGARPSVGDTVATETSAGDSADAPADSGSPSAPPPSASGSPSAPAPSASGSPSAPAPSASGSASAPPPPASGSPLGLSHEPGWLEGHGWISAPTCRQLLVSAELRRLCVDEATGRLIDLAPQVVRPELDPQAAALALQHMASDPSPLSETVWREEPEHDPGETLSEFVVLRDGLCDGPTGARVDARRAHLDHDVAYPEGPTAAWNLVARGERTHLLKHRGWTPVRTPTSTLWFSPAGQVVEVLHTHEPLQPLEADAVVPDPLALHALEAELLRPPTTDDDPPDW